MHLLTSQRRFGVFSFSTTRGRRSKMRHLLKLVVVGLFLLVLASHVSAQKVTVDSNPQAEFSRYKTFMWIKPVHYRPDPLMESRIMDAINAALTAKGLQMVPEGADIGIVTHVATREQQTLQTFYDGFGGGWRWGL